MSSDPILRFPPFEIDLAGERLMRGTETIRLRPKTFAILRDLAEHPGRMVSRRLPSGICGTFTDGAGTGDLEAARALLREDDS